MDKDCVIRITLDLKCPEQLVIDKALQDEWDGIVKMVEELSDEDSQDMAYALAIKLAYLGATGGFEGGIILDARVEAFAEAIACD